MSNKIKNILLVFIMISVLSVTVGFSALVSEMSISNIVADVRFEKDVRITDVRLVDGDVFSNSLDYSVDSIAGNVTFNSVDAEAVYEITITNFGNVDVAASYYNFEGNVNVECLEGCSNIVVSS